MTSREQSVVHGAPDRLLVTVEEAAHCLSIGRPKMWQLVMTGAILSVKIGASRRIPTAALQAYVDRLSREAADEAAERAERRPGYGTTRET